MRLSRFGPSRAGALLSIVLIGQGCAAVIERRDAPSLHARVVDSEPGALFVEHRNRVYRVEASEIEDIDHPGNVLMIIGGSLVGMGLLGVLATGGARGSETVLGVYSGVGLAFVIGGGLPWLTSKQAASRLDPLSAPAPEEGEAAFPGL